MFPLCLRSSCDPPELHSFPTRRSSDLPPRDREGRELDRADLENAVGQQGAARGALGALSESPEPAAGLRSEEHTSELQSRFDLVCRLLLEKKKKSATTPLYRAGTPTAR